MTRLLTRSAFCVAASAALVTGVAGTASAQPVQDGLVNVNVSGNTVTVPIGVAAQIAAEVCGVNVGPVAVLGRAVDRGGPTTTVCDTDQGPVTIAQNV
jgi:hypothetical protein